MAQNTTPAKVPINAIDWDAIDIFVFTNGQQHSPPRKYHLRNEELSWWKATLNYLARSQYGSLHSVIDLYTLDGKKLDDPIQLQNGAAYVAVEPPDPFIDTGYEKYLLKASSSWEKRQSRKNSCCEIVKPEEVNITISSKVEIKSEFKIDSANMQAIDETPAVLTTVGNKDENTSRIEKPPLSIDSKSTKRRNSSYTVQKPSEKKRPSVSSNPATIKESNKIQKVTALASQRTSLKCRNSVPKRISDEKALKDIENPSVVDKAPNCCKTRTSSKIKNALPTIQGSSVDEVKIEKPLLATSLTPLKDISNTKNYIHEKEHTDNTVAEKLVVAAELGKNLDPESPSIMVETYINDIKLKEVKEEDLCDCLKNETEEILSNCRNLSNQTEGDIKEQSVDKSYPSTCHQEVACDYPAEEKYITVPNMGEIIHLKLKIEVSNGENYNVKDIVKSHCITNSVTKGKILQVNSNDNIFFGRKSLQSILANEFTEDSGNNKIIVVHCQCCNKCDVITYNHSEDKKYIILLVNEQLDKNANRCQCYQEGNKTVTSSLESNGRDQPHNKSFSCISVERSTKLISETSRVPNAEKEMPPVKVDSITLPDTLIKSKTDSVEIPEGNIKCQCGRLKNKTSKLMEEVVKASYVEIVSKPFDANLKKLDDKATQTELCNFLVSRKNIISRKNCKTIM